MRILHCEIQNFGKLSNQSFDFENGCNTIYEKNGWGKSTLAMFLKVMFYGFEHEGKRSVLENDRKRYKPWQGGIYGGSITFETKNKIYSITRIFGDKEKEDVFELRDGTTNLKSEDFSKNIGEELFQINGSAFLRTIFIYQNDCSAEVNDSVNAKIGNLTEDLDDIRQFDVVDKKIKDWLNLHSPKRKTGVLYKEKEQLHHLKTQVQGMDLLESSVETLEQSVAEQKKLVTTYKEEQAKLRNQYRELRLYQESKGKKERYFEYKKDENERKLALVKEKEWFPGDIPLKSELDTWIRKSMELAGKWEAVKIYAEPDKEKLAYYEGKDLERLCKEAENQEMQEGTEHRKEQENSPFTAGDGMGIWDWMVLGILLCFSVGLGIYFDIAIGIGAGILCLALYGILKIKGREKKSSSDDERDFENLEKGQSLQELQLELKEYETLCRSQMLHIQAKEAYEALREEISRYIQSLSFEPREVQETSHRQTKEDYLEQLLEIQQHIQHYNICLEEWRSSKHKLDNFEREHHNVSQMLISQPKELCSIDEIEENLNKVEEKLETVYNNIQVQEEQLREKQEKLDFLEEQRKQLVILEKEYEEHERKYFQIEKTRFFLEEAKNRFTSRYMEPIQKGFRKYFSMITKEDGYDYQLDAKTNLFAKEYGVLRETQLLSTGWQDLVGICMRMALVDIMYQEEKPFIILDDPFVNLDDEKMEGARDFLQGLGEKYQILYFTCQNQRCFE